MQTGSSETLIGWKSEKTTIWDRMEGAWLWIRIGENKAKTNQGVEIIFNLYEIQFVYRVLPEPFFYECKKNVLYKTTSRRSGPTHYADSSVHCLSVRESKDTLPPFVPIEGHKWFFQISNQWESQKNLFAFISFGKIQFCLAEKTGSPEAPIGRKSGN